MKTILTGIQPTNTLHIGNYFGALLPMVELQEKGQLYMMLADYHAITVSKDPVALRTNILFNTAAYIAAGIDPSKTVIFQQSQVPAHTELGWILQTQTHMGEAQRMTQFKDKSQGDLNGVSVGLFTYPALMAADILLYDTEEVPVGADQKQHLELTRDLAERFNKRFGDTFTVPKPVIKASGAKILALNDPEKKMSKSSPSAKSYISLMDDADVIAKKIRSAVTDSERTITADPERKGLYNLLTICSLASGESIEDIAKQNKDKGMAGVKEATTEALVAHLAPIQMRIQELLKNEDELIKIIRDGSRKAQQVTNEKIAKVRKAIGVAL
jgi:tryptophanyl-tRNA synthetase